MSRLFFSLPVPAPLGRALLLRCPSVDGLRRSRLENLHLTVRFLGEVDAAQAEALAALVLDNPDFSLRFSRFALLSERVLYAGLEPESPVLRLAERVEAALRGLGHAPEPRPFRPHVTVGRLRGVEPASVRRLAEASDLSDLAAWRVDRLELVESRLESEGPRYRVVQAWARP